MLKKTLRVQNDVRTELCAEQRGAGSAVVVSCKDSRSAPFPHEEPQATQFRASTLAAFKGASAVRAVSMEP